MRSIASGAPISSGRPQCRKAASPFPREGNAGSNRSYTIRGIWASQIDTVSGSMKDWYSGQLDSRIPLQHDNNNSKGYNLGAGGVVKFFSNGKPLPLLPRQHLAT